MGEIFSAGQDGTKYDSLRRQNVDGTRREGTAGPLFTTVFPSNAVLSRRYRQSRPVKKTRKALKTRKASINSDALAPLPLCDGEEAQQHLLVNLTKTAS